MALADSPGHRGAASVLSAGAHLPAGLCARESTLAQLLLPPNWSMLSSHGAGQHQISHKKKAFILNYFFMTHNLDFLLLTETWLKPGESSAFSELHPPGCFFFSTLRATGRGVGLAAVSKENFKCRIITATNYYSF